MLCWFCLSRLFQTMPVPALCSRRLHQRICSSCPGRRENPGLPWMDLIMAPSGSTPVRIIIKWAAQWTLRLIQAYMLEWILPISGSPQRLPALFLKYPVVISKLTTATAGLQNIGIWITSRLKKAIMYTAISAWLSLQIVNIKTYVPVMNTLVHTCIL